MVSQAIENGLWSIKCSRDRWHHVTSKGQTVSRLSTGWGPPILYIVCCDGEAVRSSITLS